MAKPPFFVRASMLPAAQMELDVLIAEWREVQQKAAALSEREMELRIQIVEKYFPGAEEGTHTGSLTEHNLKAGIRINRSVDQGNYLAAYNFSVEKGNAHLKGLLENTFRPTFGILVGPWKQLDPADRKKLSDIVTEKPGSPSLEYAPKKS